jgi:hypothetical protein
VLDVAVHSILNLKTWHRKVALMVFTKLLPFMLTTDPYCVPGSKQLEAGPAFLYEGFDHSPKEEVYRHPEIADKKILDKQWFEKQIYSSSKLVKQVEQACTHVHSLVYSATNSSSPTRAVSNTSSPPQQLARTLL